MRRILLLTAFCLLARVASAASVNISTIAVASQTVTVTTASPHGLAVNAGFCLSAPGSVCSVAETVPTSTTFTFTQPSNVTVAPCVASCGTGSAAPRVVVLSVSQPDQATQSVRYVLWLCTTKPVPRSGFVSAWTAGAGSTGPTTPQVNALGAGSFIEIGGVENFPATSTTAEIQTFLQKKWSTQQAQLAANTQPGQFYGSVWDGAAWGVQ